MVPDKCWVIVFRLDNSFISVLHSQGTDSVRSTIMQLLSGTIFVNIKSQGLTLIKSKFGDN